LQGTPVHGIKLCVQLVYFLLPDLILFAFQIEVILLICAFLLLGRLLPDQFHYLLFVNGDAGM
jgi:hypothetical protein